MSIRYWNLSYLRPTPAITPCAGSLKVGRFYSSEPPAISPWPGGEGAAPTDRGLGSLSVSSPEPEPEP